MVEIQNNDDNLSIDHKIENIVLDKLMENFRQGNPFVSIKVLEKFANAPNSTYFDRVIRNLTTNGIIYRNREENCQFTRSGLIEYEKRKEKNQLR